MSSFPNSSRFKDRALIGPTRERRSISIRSNLMHALLSRTPIRSITLAALHVLMLCVLASFSSCSSSSSTAAPPAVAPTITIQPKDQTGYVGETATFTVSAAGSDPLTYTWQKNATQISSGLSSSYTTPVLSATDDGASYSVTVSNAKGSVTSSSAKLSVSLRPNSILRQP
jgi:Immunoglobulin domain